MTNWFTQNGKVLTNNGKIRGCCCGIRRTALLISNYAMYHQIIENSNYKEIGYCMKTRSKEYRLYGTTFQLYYQDDEIVICSSGTLNGTWYKIPSPATSKRYIITAWSGLTVEEYKNGVTTEVFNMTLAEIKAEKSGTVLFSGTIYGEWNNANPCNSGEATCTITKLDRYE